MADARPKNTPAEVESMQVAEEFELVSKGPNALQICNGSIAHLSRNTRPDIAHAVMVLTRSMFNPGPRAMVKLTRVFSCLKRTIKTGVAYRADAENDGEMEVCADADHAGYREKGLSTTGFVFFEAGATLILG